MKILRKRKEEIANMNPEELLQVNSMDAEHGSNKLEEIPESEEVEVLENSEPEIIPEKNEEEEPTDDTVTNGITEGFLKEARAFAEGKSLSPEEFDEVIDVLRSLRDPANPPTTSMFDMIHKAISYDRDVANALKQGEIEGRNTQIEKLFMQPKQTDGLPHLNGSNISSQNQSATIFDLARSAHA